MDSYLFTIDKIAIQQIKNAMEKKQEQEREKLFDLKNKNDKLKSVVVSTSHKFLD